MRIMIGIPCYRDVAGETLEDYMRFAFHLGRRTEHEYVMGIKTKSEQFRARNGIVEGALQTKCDYLFFLDDDHVLDWEQTRNETSAYDIVEKLLEHMEKDKKIGVCGAVYYHRGSECRPVLMKEGKDGGFYWLRDDEITNELQEVDVQGGGCMLLRMSMFDKIKAPWFEPEFDMGTDLQICTKAKKQGFKICCDTSIQIGHVKSAREIITPKNRHRIAQENNNRSIGVEDSIDPAYRVRSATILYVIDAEEYLGVKVRDFGTLACKYDPENIKKFDKPQDYYKSLGNEQLARQVLYHHLDQTIDEWFYWNMAINSDLDGYGADVGCGSSPIGFDLAMRGHKMDFIDLDGAGGYEFTKWRVAKRELKNCGFKLKGPYDYVFMLDSIEHMDNWKEMIEKVAFCLKDNGVILTNYFQNVDYDNPEHINMDKESVTNHLVSLGLYPLSEMTWVKRNLAIMDKEKTN